MCVLFSHTGINSTDDRDFVGHVTVAKMSKLMGKRRKGGSKLKKIAEVPVCQQSAICTTPTSESMTRYHVQSLSLSVDDLC